MKTERFSLLIMLLMCSLFMSAQHVTYRSFDHYNDRVAEFETMRAIDSTDIVMLGNSLTEYAGDWNVLLKARHIRNRGIAGDDAEGIYHRLIQILPGKPKAIFLLVGGNDLSHDLTPQQVFENCKKVIDKILKDCPSTKLYVQSLLPINESFGRWKKLEGKTDDVAAVNRLLRHYCEKNKIAYINLFKHFNRHGTNEMRKSLTVDGLHLSPQGYKIWAFHIGKYIRKL
jgi:lysophospholipase L1-like esterase